jgi:hypothetical protein
VTAAYDAAAHTLPEVRAFSQRVAEAGLRDAVRERDALFGEPLPGPTVTR